MNTTRLLFICVIASLAFLGATSSYKPVYYPYGPQTDVTVDQLRGWKRCWMTVYNTQTDLVSDVFNNCTGAHLLYGCRNQTESASFTLLAVGDRSIMMNDTGSDNMDIVSNDNGVGFYFNNLTSIGFAKEGDAVAKDSCDVESTNAEYRLCWHANTLYFDGGYRCGATDGLNDDTVWVREIWMPADPCDGKNEGDSCDDYNECTSNTTCQAGVCTGTAVDCGCFECSAATGCTTTPVSNGTSCDDNDMCTEVDTCQSGVCVGASPKECLSEQPCFNSTCVPATGQCQSVQIEGCTTPTTQPITSPFGSKAPSSKTSGSVALLTSLAVIFAVIATAIL